jgi:phosphatidate cytidylyltransferase
MTGDAGLPSDGAGSGQSKPLSNLQLRVISAVILAVVTLAVTWFGGLPFRLLAAGIAAAIFYEWAVMCRTSINGLHQLVVAAMLVGVLFLLISGQAAATVLIALAITLAAAIVHAIASGQGGWMPAGLAYAALSGISLALLRGSDQSGLVAILFLFAVVWATDIIAYFVGRAIGGPKLAPAISPGKTWSGAIGGAVGGVCAGMLLSTIAGTSPSLATFATALILSVISQAGDLFESWVKRRKGVKDSGNIIPGHGGVMDRVDGLVAAAFALYLLGWASGSADHPAQMLFPV